jgi:RNA polymerase sigma-70 factor (ECF subfamily)
MTTKEFNITVEKLRPKLMHFANGFVRTGAYTAEDLVQEAVLKLWKSQEVYQIRNTEALTMQILKNVCLDYIKIKKNNNEELPPNMRLYNENDPLTSVERREKVAHVRDLISALPPDQMLAVRLRDVMGYEMVEIAEIIGTTEGNVRTLLSRARQKLREALL